MSEVLLIKTDKSSLKTDELRILFKDKSEWEKQWNNYDKKLNDLPSDNIQGFSDKKTICSDKKTISTNKNRFRDIHSKNKKSFQVKNFLF